MIPVEPLRLGFAFSAGLATFFAPCAYPLLPGYVAFYLGDAGQAGPLTQRLRRATAVGSLASLGFVLVYVLLAGVVAALGTEILRNIAVLELFVGGLLVVLGIGIGMSAGRLPLSSSHVPLPKRRRSKSGFLLFGVVYAVAAAGCTAPIFVGLVGIAVSAGPVGTLLLFLTYTGGMVTMLVTLTLLVALGHDHVFGRLSGSATRLTRIAGALLALAGLAQIYLFLFRFGGLAMFGLA